MLQTAIPQTIRDELVATRSLRCVGVICLICHVLRLFQPGGLPERTRLLEQLTIPGQVNSATKAVNKLRGALTRAQQTIRKGTEEAWSSGEAVAKPTSTVTDLTSMLDWLQKLAPDAPARVLAKVPPC